MGVGWARDGDQMSKGGGATGRREGRVVKGEGVKRRGKGESKGFRGKGEVKREREKRVA
jgi:hypothetical protein